MKIYLEIKAYVAMDDNKKSVQKKNPIYSNVMAYAVYVKNSQQTSTYIFFYMYFI